MNAKWKDFAKTAQWNYDANSSANGLGYAVSQPMSKSPGAGKARDLYEITSYGGRLDDRQRRNAVKAETAADAQAANARAMQERARQIEAERARWRRDQISNAADRNHAQRMFSMNPAIMAPSLAAVGGVPTTLGSLASGAAGAVGASYALENLAKHSPGMAATVGIGLQAMPWAAKYGPPMVKAVGREVYRDARHALGRSPTVSLAVGPKGYFRANYRGADAGGNLGKTISRLPGESDVVYFAQPKLNAVGRAMLDTDSTYLDRIVRAFHPEEVSIGRMFSKSPGKKTLEAAYPNAMKDVTVGVYDGPGFDARFPDAKGALGASNASTGRIGISSGANRKDAMLAHEYYHKLQGMEDMNTDRYGNVQFKPGAEDAYRPAMGVRADYYVKRNPGMTREVAERLAANDLGEFMAVDENAARAAALVQETGASNFRDAILNPNVKLTAPNGLPEGFGTGYDRVAPVYLESQLPAVHKSSDAVPGWREARSWAKDY